ncbi:MAG: SPOR domain-containing protein [Xanthomonadales bacterium]|nr:Cell division protein DedD [Xanthomonadales bacterium]MCC6591638.1 SPOR domain-containing protein [Xanthomonadales bacterium]MCE7930074.1 SPOR domain-containing protein [Xanthomonadales bacterium PRO6]
MDDALRQRLVGAAVIIALAVIFVPMLLDSPEPSQRTQQVDLTIPPRTEPGMETRRLPLDPAMTAPQPATEPVAAGASPDVSDPVPADGGIAALDTPAAAPPKPQPAPTAEVPARPDPPKPEAPKPDAAKPQVAAASLPQPATGGRFLAQFGSYAERANAEALVRDLAKAGVPATLETLPGTSGRPLHRVRSKPYATRAEADAARLGAQRQIAGLASSVVELAAADATQSTPARPNLSGWAVQVGVFTRKDGAEELAKRLRDGGYAAFVEPVKLAGGQTSHRVRVGPEVKRENAQRIQGELKSKFKLDALVVAHP